MGIKGQKANLLGDLRAEADLAMLEQTFLETMDYRTLIETTDRPIVIGRRGTGKSALSYKLGRHWHSAERTIVIHITPTEDQMIGLRDVSVQLFSTKYSLLRAGSKIAWKYAISMEIADRLSKHYKFNRAAKSSFVQELVRQWRSYGTDPSERLRRTLLSAGSAVDASGRLAEIAGALLLNQLQESLVSILGELQVDAVVLIDRVDEGYEPDITGVALVDGLVLAAIDTNTRFEKVRTTLFLRDNMARALEQLDPDFSRDIEGQLLRLHWEESQLLSLVTKRLRAVFSLAVESDIKVWNRCVAKGLEGRDGFKKCLRLTLYRPRDILALLNQAFLRAGRDNRTQIIDEDVEATANEISRFRLEDLRKEYEVTLPGLWHYIGSFTGGPPSVTVSEAFTRFEGLVQDLPVEPDAIQTFRILNSGADVAGALYSVGFLGIKDPATGSVLFCHDGRPLDRTLLPSDKLMVHPCYWLGLGLMEQELDPAAAEDIFDDYDIRVISQAPEIRKAQLGKIIGEVSKLEIGQDDSSAFEDWCLRAVGIAWPTQLHNIELHPNRAAVNRRDVVATNLSEGGVWRRVYDDYRVRQVVFEIKNYVRPTAEDYRQVLAYLGGDYGNCGFIVCRDSRDEITVESELPIVKEIYNKHHKLIVKLTASFFVRILSKLRTPQRHDEGNEQLSKLLDRYTRLYLQENSARGPKNKRR